MFGVCTCLCIVFVHDCNQVCWYMYLCVCNVFFHVKKSCWCNMYLCVHCLFPCKHACGHMYMCVHCIFLCKHALWCMYVCVHFIFPCMHACCCMNLSLAIGDIHSLNYKPYNIWIPHKIVVIALKFKPSVFTGKYCTAQ